MPGTLVQQTLTGECMPEARPTITTTPGDGDLHGAGAAAGMAATARIGATAEAGAWACPGAGAAAGTWAGVLPGTWAGAAGTADITHIGDTDILTDGAMVADTGAMVITTARFTEEALPQEEASITGALPTVMG